MRESNKRRNRTLGIILCLCAGAIGLLVYVYSGVYIGRVDSGAGHLDATTTAPATIATNSSLAEKKNTKRSGEERGVAAAADSSVGAENKSLAEQKYDLATKFIKNQNKSSGVFDAVKVKKYLIESEDFKGTNWRHWKSARAVRIGQEAEGGDVLYKMGGFSIVDIHDQFDADGNRLSTSGAAESSMEKFRKESPVVVYDEGRNRPGIVTGLLKVKTAYKEKLERTIIEIKKTEGMSLAISDSYESIQLYYIIANDTEFNLSRSFVLLKEKDFVDEVEIDILDRAYEKN